MPYARNQSAVAETDTVLVAAPGANRQIVVKSLTVSNTTAQTVLIESSTGNRRFELYMPATDTKTFVDPAGLFRCAANESLTYTTTAAAAFFISVRYDEARSLNQ